MKVFISWSGELSRQVAELLRDWIQNPLQFVEPWMSKQDIQVGSVWFDEIGKELSATGVGILCLTPENLTAPWVLFEAGALFKGLAENRVCPLLISLQTKDVGPPLAQLNLTLADREGVLKLIRTINAQAGEKKLTDERVQKSFEKWWDDFDTKVTKIVGDYKPKKGTPKRTVEDMIEELLALTRRIQTGVEAQKSLVNMLPYLGGRIWPGITGQPTVPDLMSQELQEAISRQMENFVLKEQAKRAQAAGEQSKNVGKALPRIKVFKDDSSKSLND